MCVLCMGGRISILTRRGLGGFERESLYWFLVVVGPMWLWGEERGQWGEREARKRINGVRWSWDQRMELRNRLRDLGVGSGKTRQHKTWESRQANSIILYHFTLTPVDKSYMEVSILTHPSSMFHECYSIHRRWLYRLSKKDYSPNVKIKPPE